MYRVVAALLLLLASTARADPTIIDRPIRFDDERIALTRDYIKQHYGLAVKDIRIVPKAIVIHWTGGSTNLEASWRTFNRVRMETGRRYLVRGGAVNVSAHFLVGRDGTIYRLMPETRMARHCIGLNYDSIGIENLGGGARWPLTDRQLEANVALVRYLAGKHPIRTLLGHMEWKRFESSPLFRELDPTYRNAKDDPGPVFMRRLRARLKDLRLADRPK
jgi:N-acetyl-anhydromuramyl-L-alanine amidase AmpD